MSALPTVADSLRLAAGALSASSESPRLDAELLLGKVLGLSRSSLTVRGSDPVTAASGGAFEELIASRARGVPVAYLVGQREFWSLNIAVTPAVLVPRPDTELLVELALQRLAAIPTGSVLDLGTGSGAIALAIASERPHARVTGIDVCPAALAVAKHNAAALGLSRIDWRLGSWFEPVTDTRFDVIVSNPPYVAAGDAALARLVAEPLLALVPGPTGLEALGAIIERAAAHLAADGWLLLEHGSAQGADVARLFAQRGFRHVRSHADHAGNPRVTGGTLASTA